jgi:hypothetical protein
MPVEARDLPLLGDSAAELCMRVAWLGREGKRDDGMSACDDGDWWWWEVRGKCDGSRACDEGTWGWYNRY